MKYWQCKIQYTYVCCVYLPDTPPYVVRWPAPTFGQGLPSAFSPIRPETVLVAVTPSAPPKRDTKISMCALLFLYVHSSKWLASDNVQPKLRKAVILSKTIQK